MNSINILGALGFMMWLGGVAVCAAKARGLEHEGELI